MADLPHMALSPNMNLGPSTGQWPMAVLEWQSGPDDPAVLVADDDADVRDLITVKLTAAGSA